MLSENEKRVLFSLVRYPDLTDRQISDTIGFKYSTFSTIKHRLAEGGYVADQTIPLLQNLGAELAERKRIEAEREKLIADLQDALDSIKTLNGLLPICASCKKIRDDQGYWQQIESYIRDHSEAEFTHGLCPDCAEKAFSEIRKMKGPAPDIGHFQKRN